MIRREQSHTQPNSKFTHPVYNSRAQRLNCNIILLQELLPEIIGDSMPPPRRMALIKTVENILNEVLEDACELWQ